MWTTKPFPSAPSNIVTFATACTPIRSADRWIQMTIWVWLHLLQANVSNQNFSLSEDIINKPWRPLPSGRISERSTSILRWSLFVENLMFSLWLGGDVCLVSVLLACVEFFHDDLGYSRHPLWKNVLNVGGYATFELGATLIMCKFGLDDSAILALILSGSIILTTIQAQDFADREGDKKSSRRTLPISFPEGSRVYTFLMLVVWSFTVSRLWHLGPISSHVFISFGSWIGYRYYSKRMNYHVAFTFIADLAVDGPLATSKR
ncbi:hypothetical protein FISHEDRAFT_67929 [Fistulina hepatica ATCC 64428]|nr:hypothetical protein FISHEDRAFT_67929 [Fistulina hepatica ATCC 64428]